MKKLEIDALFQYTKSRFDKFKDNRADNKQYSIGDAVQSGLAIFSLKDSSMLEFNKRITERAGNLNGEVRKLLDEVAPVQIERVKRGVLQQVKEKGLFKEFEYFKGYKLLLIDGVHHFSSDKIKCVNCSTTHHQDGSITYSHSMLSAVIAHPEKKVVLPLCEEPIIQQDGVTKNDCELNASKRLLKKVRTRHLAEKFIRVEDALYANGPHIREIQTEGDKFIIRVKPGSGAGSVIEQYEALLKMTEAKRAESQKQAAQAHKLFKRHRIEKPIAAKPQIHKMKVKGAKIIKEYHYVNGLYLNETHKDLKVNFVHYEERSIKTGKVLKRFQWITDIKVTDKNVDKVVRAGRGRWKIENETFNTLKNQGYHFKHNFGHGEKHLCTNFALLMMLAFLIDQIQQLTNDLFQKALKKSEWKKYLWDDVRSFFKTMPFDSMEMIYNAIIYGFNIEYLAIRQSSD